MSNLRTKERDKKVADMWRPDLDAELAASNAAKGTSAGYTNSPKGLSKIELPEKIDEVAPVVMQPKSFLTQFIENTTPPITAEEQAKRQRAATARQGIQALGNAMSALSNLTFSSMGALSQTIPNQEVEKTGKAMTSWQERLKAEREKYQAAELGAKTQQWKMEQEERRYADALKQQGIENTIKLGNLELSRYKLANDSEYQKEMLDLRAKELIQNGKKADQAFAQAMKELGLRERSIKLSESELQARKDGSYYSKSGSTGKAPTYLDVNGTIMRYNEDVLTDAASMQAANILGVGDEVTSPTQARMIVGAALNNKDPKLSEEDKKKIADVAEYLIGVGAISAESNGSGEKKLGLNKKTISWDEQ